MKIYPLIFVMTLASQTFSQSPGKYATINGLKMYYEIHGEGYPLVLIHGGGSTIETTFGRIISTLAKTHKVIAVEMQAHGHTADIDRPLSFEQDADDIAALLEILKIKSADIFGFSNGATTTLQVAIRHPEIINKIIVASTMYKRDGAFKGFFEMMKNASFEGMPQQYKDAFLKINPDNTALHRMYERDVTRMQNFQDIGEEQIKSIKAPTLILAGNQDVVTPEHSVEMHRKIQNSQLAILPGAHGDYLGEITTIKENSNHFPAVEIIGSFLSEKK